MFNWKKKTALLLAGLAMAGSAFAADVPLALDAKQFEARNGAKVNWKNGVLDLKIHNPEWSGGVRINPPAGQKFDFSKGRYLACDVENTGDRQMRLTMHISSGERGSKSSSHVDLPHREVNTGIGLNPGEKRTMRIYLPHASLFLAPEGGKHMRVLDTAKINSIEFQLQWPFELPRKYLVDCRISNIRLEGEPEYDKKIAGSKDYLPFIDRYGQYIHSDWPEKIHSDEQLVKEHQRELAELDSLPPIADWNEYGGWATGPQLEATGSFRVEKYQGKWFFVDPSGRLFWSTGIDVLRNNLGLTSVKEGCSEGECGACTVIYNGEPVTSCCILAGQADGADIITLEGVSKDGQPDVVQQAFMDAGAVQCGFCIPGMILTAEAFLKKNPNPTRDEVKLAISGNLCRCTGYAKINDAVLLAAARMRGEEAEA